MFYKKINMNNNKKMFEFLKQHCTYWTMNSWNRLESIANNVKIYNLNLEGDHWKALECLEKDDYFCINCLIEDWEYTHKNYRLSFNGRSGGYLVLCNKKNNCNILPNLIVDSLDYEDFKNECKVYYGGVKNYKEELKYYVNLVQDFDKLCDELRNEVNYLSLHYDEFEEENEEDE